MFKDYILACTACNFTTHVTLACGKPGAINPMGNKGNPRDYLLQAFCENTAGSSDESTDLCGHNHTCLGKHMKNFKCMNRKREKKKKIYLLN